MDDTIGCCPICGVEIDRERQCTALGEAICTAAIADPFTGIEHEAVYCVVCADIEFGPGAA